MATSHASALEHHTGELEQRTTELVDAHAKLHDREQQLASNQEALQRADDLDSSHAPALEHRAAELVESHAHISACEKLTGLELSVNTYTTLTSACKKGRKAEKAIAKRHKKEKAMELDADSQQPVEYHRPSWADIAGDQVRPNAVLQQRGLELNEIPDEIPYNALIRYCAKDHRVEKAMELFAEMQQIGLIPDRATFIALISACAKGNQADSALIVFAVMQKTGMTLEDRALLSACDKGGVLEKLSLELREACLV